MNTIQEQQEVDPLDREFAPGWAAEPGDKVRGSVFAVDERNTEFGSYPIYTLAITDGYSARTKSGELVTEEVAIHARRDVLRRKLANAKLQDGDEVGIKYLGPPKGTARSHRYRVIVYLPDGGFREIAYDPDDELDRAPEDDTIAETQVALEVERDERAEAADDIPF